MLVSVLASGSEGNCTYVETSDAKILIDIGMNNKYIKEKLADLGVATEEIDYIFMTHAHKDHTGALDVFIKKNSPTVIVTKAIRKEIEALKSYENVIEIDEKMTVWKTTVDPFKVSHDAVDAHGYLIEDENSSLVYMTDTGYLNQKYFAKLHDKDVYIIEANHDVEKLINGSYPKWLKSRILSDQGHLSNNATGFYLSKLIGPKTKKVVLAHLSKENNDEEIALATVKKTLKEYDIEFENISIARQKERTETIVV